MVHQPRFETFEGTKFFADGAVARPVPAGTVPRDATSWEADAFEPLPAEEITLDLLRRGRQRYEIYCSMCHARDGYGNGMVVQRGFPAPPSMHEERLRRVPDAHIYNVISNGLGNMPPYGGMIPPADRRAIIAYVRAMQLSQNASVDDVPSDQRDELSMSADDHSPSGVGLRARDSDAGRKAGRTPVPPSQPGESPTTQSRDEPAEGGNGG